MDSGSIIYTSQHMLQQLLDLLFPPRCAACQYGGNVLCPACLATIRPLSPPYCLRCHTPLSPGTACTKCCYMPLQLSGLRMVSRYEGALRLCIHALKYTGNRRLAEPLGTLLAQAYRHYGLHADMVTPVPLHSTRLRQRGYNQSLLLAQVCSQHIQIPLDASLLTRVRATASQVDLSLDERQGNVSGAFVCSPAFTRGALHGRDILLIDDVCTTGATLEACAAPLFAAGARAVWALVLARPLPHYPA